MIHSLVKKVKTSKNAKELSKECILHLKKDYSSPEFNYNEGFLIINIDLNLRIPEEKGGKNRKTEEKNSKK